MTIPGSASPLLLRKAAAGGYAIERSVRFNSVDSAYLSRTPASAGNRKTWTWAGWVKRSKVADSASGQVLFSRGDTYIYFAESANVDNIGINLRNASTNYWLMSSAVYRDVGAWMHVCVALDTTLATAADRLKLWVNGAQVTSYSLSSYTSISQNYEPLINTAAEHRIGNLLNGYLADIHFIDGQALDPTSFGEFDATTGVWNPKAYTGSFGANGFHLPFDDNSTAAALGTDTSGNGNTWTVNNISVTAGAGNDSVVDVPTNGTETDSGIGGEVRGNYCTLNPLANGGLTLTNGNLDISRATASWKNSRGTFGITSGKWYWDFTLTGASDSTNGPKVGYVVSSATLDDPGGDAYGWAYLGYNGTKWNNGVQTSYGAIWSNGDVIGVAFDADAGTLTFYKNGVSQGTAFTGLTSGPYFPVAGIYGTSSGVLNFGQRPFAYTAPSGFKALCTANLPAPVVTKPSEYMDVKLYTGNGSTQTISGLEFSPDFVWTKLRSIGFGHRVWDTVRGATKRLETHATTAEVTESTALTAFTSDGFTVGSEQNVNLNGGSMVAWCWDAGSSTVSNPDGSITSSVRANASAGFSIVTYQTGGTGSTLDTVGHGLGVAPVMVILKNRDQGFGWLVGRSDFSSPTQDYMQLNTTDAKANAGTATWSFSSTTVGIRQSAACTTSGANMVVYCFAPVNGYSSFGSYTGNGSTDGPFVYTGFRPRWLMVKSTGSGAWIMHDTSRNPYNASVMEFQANDAAAEYNTNTFSAGDRFDILSNGFKSRTTNSYNNSSGQSYLYIAFAESPFQYARAR